MLNQRSDTDVYRAVRPDELRLAALLALWDRITASLPDGTDTTQKLRGEAAILGNAPLEAVREQEHGQPDAMGPLHSGEIRRGFTEDGSNHTVRLMINGAAGHVRLLSDKPRAALNDTVEAFEEALAELFPSCDDGSASAATRIGYQALVVELKGWKQRFEAAQTAWQEVMDHGRAVEGDRARLGEQLIEATEDRQAIKEAREGVTSMKSQVEEDRKAVGAMKGRLEDYTAKVEHYEQRMKGQEGKIHELLTEATSQLESSANTWDDRLEAWDTRVDRLAGEVQTLLKGAVAGRLYEVFEAKELKHQTASGWWLLGVVAALVAVAGVPVAMLDRFGGLASVGWDAVTFLKLSASLPFVALAGFCIREFSRNRLIAQRYNFKGAIALSLKAYEELLSEEGRAEEVQHFLVETIREIYRPLQPPDQDLPKSLRKMKAFAQVLRETGVVDAAKTAGGVASGKGG